MMVKEVLEEVTVRQICLTFGRFRLRIIRLWKGGPCPMTVLTDDWTLVPTLHKQDDNSERLNLSPGKVFSGLLSRVLRRHLSRGFHGLL